ncbi:MAG: hypothetical protein ACK4S4_15740 [Pyrinomonadaceae bacterium]
MSLITPHDGYAYFGGMFATATTGFFAGLEPVAAAGVSVILPALVLLVVNLPKFLRELLLLYREYKRNPDNDTRPTERTGDDA